VLQCVAVCCSVLQCVAVCCSVLQYVAVCCSLLQCVVLRFILTPHQTASISMRRLFYCLIRALLVSEHGSFGVLIGLFCVDPTSNRLYQYASSLLVSY